MFWGIIKVIIIAAILLFIAWVGLNVWSCFNQQDAGQSNLPDMPDQEEASYSVYIENTGNLILTNDYETHGSEVGSRVFILHSFWELRGQGFKFVPGEIVLDEAIFGEITVERRKVK